MSVPSRDASPPATSLADRRLYLCTSDRPDLASFLEACIVGGVDVVQLREKHLRAAQLAERAAVLVEMCRRYGVPAIVNDYPDMAAEVGASGVHVGQDDVDPESARAIVGARSIVGLSTHDPDQLRRSLDAPVDYVSAGPVVPTPTKPGRPGTGIGYVSLAVRSTTRPVFVTGGVTPDSVGRLVEAGARHFVVVRYLTESDDPAGAARALRRAIDEAIARADQVAPPMATPGASTPTGQVLHLGEIAPRA